MDIILVNILVYALMPSIEITWIKKMKSKDLSTIFDIVVTNYKIEKNNSGKFRHSFNPSTTNRVYEFTANEAPVVKEKEHYNIGYMATADGRFIIETSALSLTSAVSPHLSYLAAKSLSEEKLDEEKAKNDARVRHSGTGDYYWAKKQAWRMYGAFMAEDAFIAYLNEIGHTSIPCIMYSPDHPPSESTAYANTGLEEAAYDLMISAEKKTATFYKSPLFSKKFTIKGLNAISHKK